MKIDSRADTLEAEKVDVSRARDALKTAEDLIAKARELIGAQASKTYPINVTVEENLGENVRAARAAFHDDVSKIRQTLHDAREALNDAAFALKNTAPPENEPENNSSGN